MQIVNPKYLSTDAGENYAISVEIDGTLCDVPLDTENRHYAAILEWVADGNTIAEPD